MVKSWNLWKTYKQKKTTQKARTLKRGTNGRKPEPPKISKGIPKSGAPFVIGKWIVCGWVLSFKQSAVGAMFRGKFPRIAFIHIPWSTARKKSVQISNARKYARHY
jgi:hypothetical protein